MLMGKFGDAYSTTTRGGRRAVGGLSAGMRICSEITPQRPTQFGSVVQVIDGVSDEPNAGRPLVQLQDFDGVDVLLAVGVTGL